VALTFWQKLRVAFHGWQRRREDANAAFLAKNAAWTGAVPIAEKRETAAKAPPASRVKIDIEGLQVAFLDDSGQIDYYLDTMTGEVLELRNKPAPPGDRFQRVPSHGSETDERRAFVATLEDSPVKASLGRAVDSPEFRRLLATDRTLERGWYNFRNAQATRSIEAWLRQLGLPADRA